MTLAAATTTIERIKAAAAALGQDVAQPGRALKLSVAALTAALAWQSAALVWAIGAPIGPVGAPAPAAAAVSRPAADLAALVRVDPFFRAAAAESGVAPDLSDLGLELFAVRAGGPDGGAAIVQIPGRGQRSISIGEEVAPGVRLVSVHADHAVFERGGARLQLTFPSLPAAPAEGGPAAAAAAPIDGDATLRVASTIDPQAFLAELALQARIENGEVTGYTLRDGRQGQIMRRIGLQPGDVLLEVNNRRLVDDERVAELQDELMSRPEAVIRYERNGEVRTATVRITPP